ncbi:MAG TPA: anti-sigma factor, partial [Longimicrobiales bacterium]|nr:anti-sigma factor [Longimicrobiales bacterium]
YNYILIIPGQGTAEDPVPAGPPVLRAQVGPDIDDTGRVIDNALAPFPSAALTEAELAVTPGFRGVPNRIELTVQGLPELFGDAVYKAWLYNSERPEQPPVPAVGNLTFVEHGQTIPGGTFATWRGGLDLTTRLEVSDATLGGARLRDFDHVAIAVQLDGASGSPAPPAFWARYVDHRGTPDDFLDNLNIPTGTIRFGSFALDAVEQSKTFAPGGTLRGSFYRDTLVVAAEGAAVPPAGFHYELWLKPAGGGAQRYAGTLPLDERGFGAFRLAEADVGRFGDYVGVEVTLEANAAPASPGPYRVFSSEDWTVKFRNVFGSP